MFRGSPNQKLLCARKVVSLLVLGCLLLACVPIPIGTKITSRSTSEPFPCMDCHCGCTTPEHCWTNCCCYNPAERAEWAEEHGVTPPSYAVLSQPTKAISVDVSTSRACCSRPVAARCEHCQSDAESPRSSSASCTTQPCTTENAAQCASSQSTLLVLSVAALRCQGASSQFTLLPWAILDLSSIDSMPVEPQMEPYLVFNESSVARYVAPDTPPPRH